MDTDGTVGKNKGIRIFQDRIANSDKYERLLRCCDLLRLRYAEEKNGIRIYSDFNTRMRFLFEFGVNHSMKRDRLLLNSTIKGSKHSTIDSIARNGNELVYNLQTESENFIANGFIVHNCYMRRWGKLPDLHIVEAEFKDFDNKMKKYGDEKFIFVGSSTDMFAESVPHEWIKRVLLKCSEYDNRYLFQSKNPERFFDFKDWEFPQNVILGTTIETNRDYKVSKAPSVWRRATALATASFMGYDTMVSIEPIMDFDVEDFIFMIRYIKPKWISIGADSQRHNLSEPSADKLKIFLRELSSFVEIRQKRNLDRLLRK